MRKLLIPSMDDNFYNLRFYLKFVICFRQMK